MVLRREHLFSQRRAAAVVSPLCGGAGERRRSRRIVNHHDSPSCLPDSRYDEDADNAGTPPPDSVVPGDKRNVVAAPSSSANNMRQALRLTTNQLNAAKAAGYCRARRGGDRRQERSGRRGGAAPGAARSGAPRTRAQVACAGPNPPPAQLLALSQPALIFLDAARHLKQPSHVFRHHHLHLRRGAPGVCSALHPLRPCVRTEAGCWALHRRGRC